MRSLTAKGYTDMLKRFTALFSSANFHVILLSHIRRLYKRFRFCCFRTRDFVFKLALGLIHLLARSNEGVDSRGLSLTWSLDNPLDLQSIAITNSLHVLTLNLP